MATGFPIIFGSGKLWTPALITTAMWLDANDASTITLNGSTVSQWTDKSGNGRNATQSTAANQPIYNRIGYNNKPTLSFDGVNDFLNMVDGSVPAGNANYSMFVVQQINVMADMMMMGRPIGGGTGTACFMGVIASNAYGNWLQGSGIGAVVSALEQNMYAAVFNNISNVITLTKNGDAFPDLTLPFTRNGIATQQAIGGDIVNNSRYGNFLFSEAIILHSTAPVATRQLIEGYLAWKWGTASSLPSSHPYKNAPPYA